MNGYKDFITEVSDFPKSGVGFKDISPLLADQETFRSALVDMGGLVDDNLPDYWVGIDARGFIFASALATYFGGGVVLARKKGKLPPPTIDVQYNTEYSMDHISIKKGTGNIVIVDDVLATGGTLMAVNELCEEAGYNIIDNLVLIDLKYVERVVKHWPKNNKDFDLDVKSLIQYEQLG
jgi:adenine phosphoribosyltransferase